MRVAGSGHSFSPIVATDGLLLSLEHLAGIEAFDEGAMTATVRAGTRLHDLGDPLLALGVGLENQGDVDVQALGGAIATGTHGTGATLGSLSTQVTGMRLVGADGEVEHWDEASEARGRPLDAARVSLGMLGIASAITLRVRPAYRLHERTWRTPVDEALGALDGAIAAHRHYEFFWWPHRDLVEHKALDPTELAPGAAVGRHERVDWSHRIFPTVRDLRFNEMEYAVPAEAGAACFLEVRARMRERHADVAWPVEFRTLAADGTWLGTASGRATVTISLHQAAELPCEAFFRDCEAIFVAHGGRPHWGKMHFRDAAALAGNLPGRDRFRALRAAVDPAGRFLNDHLEALFGPA